MPLRAKDDKIDKQLKGAVYLCTSPLHYSGERVIIAYFLSKFCVSVCFFLCFLFLYMSMSAYQCL